MGLVTGTAPRAPLLDLCASSLPGDPMRFHAHYIALCCPPGAPLPLCDIVAAARLGTSVKKTVLLCSAGEDGVVIYTSLQWSGLQ